MTPARIIAYRARQRALGRKRRELWATDAEWLEVRRGLELMADFRLFHQTADRGVQNVQFGEFSDGPGAPLPVDPE